MTQTSNQFIQSVEKGQLTLDPNYSYNAQVSANEAATLVAAQSVLIEDAAGAQIPVIKATVTTQAIFGFINYNVRTDSSDAQDQVKILRRGVMHMEAGAAIARGAALEVVITGNKVQTKATGTTIGIALDKAAADGDLIRVEVNL